MVDLFLTEYLAFALIGLGVGAFYAALATGIVVTYRGTGVINFAAGAMGSWGVYTTDELRKTGDLVLPLVGVPDRIDLGMRLATVPAVAGGVVSAAMLGLLVHLLVFRPLRSAPTLAKVVATVGVMLVTQALIVANFGHEPRQVARLLPGDSVSIGGIGVPVDRLLIAAVAVAVTIGLWAYFHFTRIGLATLAGAENERAIASARFSPQGLAGAAWALASAATAFVLILASPFTVISPVVFTVAIVPALASVMLARLSSLGMALIAGFGLGSLNSILTFSSTQELWPAWARVGITEAVQFAVLAVALFALGRSLPERGSVASAPLPPVHLPTNRPGAVAAMAALAILAVVLTSGSYRFGVITSMIIAIVALSLVVLTGFVGQISLAQAAFAGTSGFVLSKLLANTGLGFPAAPLLAALAATVVGLIVGLPALRIRGAHLAVVTLGLAVAVERFVFRNPALSPGTGNPIGDPVLFGVDLGVREGRTIARVEFGLLVAAITVAAFVAVANIVRATTGRRFLAVRSNEQAAAGVGVNVAATKLTAFAVSSFLAGVGGVLLGYSRGQLSADSFTVFVGLSILTFAYLGGITSLSGAVVAGTFAPLGIGFIVLDRSFQLGSWYLLGSGIGLILTAIFNPVGIAGANRELLRRYQKWSGRIEPTPAGQASPGTPLAVVKSPTTRTVYPGPAVVLDVANVDVSFAGLRAVDDVSIQVRAGAIVGLIGANGAGKTTLLDAIGGFVEHRGTITVDGEDVSNLPPHRRARAGIGRTWQSIQLFGDLSVADNLRTAAERPAALAALADIVRPNPDSAGVVNDRVVATLEQVGLDGAADRPPHELSLGRQKLVGLGRAIVSVPKVVLLDEPAAGLDETARRRLVDRLIEVVNSGTSILIVDHDMNFVFDICDEICVLDVGRVIAAGAPSTVRANPAVATAYLGT